MHTQKKMDVFRSKSIFRFGLYASLFGFLEVTAALMILIYAKTRVRDGQFADTWRDTALIDTWLSLNSAIHILLGAIVFGSGIGLLQMRDWGRRGLVLYSLVSSLWVLVFALISTTWIVLMWNSGWDETAMGEAVNWAGVCLFFVWCGALAWLVCAGVLTWSLKRSKIAQILNRFDRGLPHSEG